MRPQLLILAMTAALCAGCGSEEMQEAGPARQVRTVTIGAMAAAPDLVFRGHIEAEDQPALAFRISGRMTERLVGIGDSVREGQTVARLEPQNELNGLRLAQSALTAAEGLLRQAENQYQRHSHLFNRGHTPQSDLEASEQARTAARAQVDAARANLKTAEEVVAFTTLEADAPGVVTAVGAEPGEVVAAGRMIVQLARRGGRDGVFEVPANVVRSITPDMRVTVDLASDSPVTAHGRVREIAPQADPQTRTFRIRVGLVDPPPAFRLGMSVSGRISGVEAAGLSIPVSALIERGGATGVWIVDPDTLKVSLRKLDILDTTPAMAIVGKGLAAGDIVVAAGASLLRDGQVVRLAGAEPR